MRLRDDPKATRLAACLAASLVAHAGLVAWMPQLHRHSVDVIPAVLSVALPPAPTPVAPALPALPEAASEAPPMRAPAPKPAVRTATTRAPAPAPAAPTPTLREPVSRSAPLVAAETVPTEPGPVAASAPVAEGVRAEAAAATGPRASAPAAPSVVPPSFGAAYLRNPAPRYPPDARRDGAEGTVLLRVWVAPDGAATRVEIDRSSGHRALDAAALGAVRNWRFVPARRGDEPAEGVVVVPLVFRLESGG